MSVLSLALCALGCVRDTGFADSAALTPAQAPRHRADGPRLPAFSGRDPVTRGWKKVDDLLWLEARDVEAYRAGRIFHDGAHVPLGAALPPGVPAERGFRLRTDHLALSTNLRWDRAKAVAREAERHVARIAGEHGEALGVRLPADPLPLVVAATRAEFERTLRGLVQDPIGWGAFYDARAGIVHVSTEPAPQGALPWPADLRHEMTHQILDLSRSPSRRVRGVEPPWFWLWEGIAIWSEGLGDTAGIDTGLARIVRFRKRYAWSEWTPLAELVTLPQLRFEGRHYDQVASLMRFLMDPAVPERRQGVLDLVRRVLAGPVDAAALERATGLALPTLERAWLSTVGR